MARKVTDELIEQMVERYAEVGTYAQVARDFGVSPSTASKYIKQALAEQEAVKPINFAIDLAEMQKTVENYQVSWEDLDFNLTDKEREEMEELGRLI